MKELLKLFILLSMVLFCFSIASGQDIESEAARIIQNKFSADEPGVSVLIAQHGKVLYRKALGMANLELQVPLQPENKFRIASITKQFTAVAILQLAENDELRLDDDIRKYLPEFHQDGAVITIENLLTHTSGLGNQDEITNWDQLIMKPQISPRELISIFINQPLAFEPGTQYKYSNFGYWLLGYIVEQVSGLAYADYLSREIFEPLGLKDTSYDNMDSIITNRIPGYSNSSSGYLNASYLDMRVPYAGGGLISNVDDLLNWYQHLYSKEGPITQETVATAHQPYTLSNGQTTNYGYGWMIGLIKGRKTVKHDGIINGFTSFVLYIPEDSLFVATLTNCDCNRDIELTASKLAALALGEPFSYPGLNISRRKMIELQGVYESALGAVKFITIQDDEIMYHDKGGGKTKMVPIKEDQFWLEENLSKVTINRGNNGELESYTLTTLADSSTWVKTDIQVEPLKSKKLILSRLQKYTGKYEFEGAFTLQIFTKEDKLFGGVGGDIKELAFYDNDSFFVLEMDARLQFSTSAEGEVTGLTFIQSSEMYAKKVE
ncbi:MAG: hypothetical protein DHS20C17_24530 [Cyclobacteriaceae bacterium]|nr:MAG: hypothetical protein DHS20C17_24530 [Cyclobacteriaceae bacterium]